MNFTPQETKLIERLRKHDRQWRWARWLVLVMGVFSAGLCTAFGYILHGLIAESEAGHFDGQTVFFIVLIWTKCVGARSKFHSVRSKVHSAPALRTFARPLRLPQG